MITQALLQSAEAQIKYSVIRLVPISGVDSYPNGLNAQGDVVGDYYWRVGTQEHVFLNHAGVMHDIPALAGSYAAGINIYGRIVGYTDNFTGYTYFQNKLWTLSNTIPDLLPMAVNNASHIACMSDSGTLIWQKSGITFLPTPITPTAINNSDQVVGYALNPQGNYHAFLISGGKATDLGTFQNLPSADVSFAYGVNDQGQIAGTSYFSFGEAIGHVEHAFIYSGGRMQDIQTIDPYDASVAYGINNSGHVVGQFHDFSNGNLRAFVFDGSKMIDLNTLIAPAAGWVLVSALAINDAGQIMGYGSYRNGSHQESYLLTPVR